MDCKINLGLFEIMDRLSVIQQNMHDFIYLHEEVKGEYIEELDKAAEILADLYQKVAEDFYNSCEDDWE